MALSKFKLKSKFGPPALRKQTDKIVEEINKRSPLEGFGIQISEKPEGRSISLTDELQAIVKKGREGVSTAGASSGGGSSNVIATEFVSVGNSGIDAGEILYSHEIGAGRLANDGDCIKATYALRITAVSINIDTTVRFGDGIESDLVIADGSGLNFANEANIRIEVLIMRSGADTFRFTTSIFVSVGYYDSDFARHVACGVAADAFISDFSNDLVISLWGGAFGVGAAPGQVTARLALIEYIPS